MKLVFRMFLLCSVLCLICSNSWAYADTYAPKIGHPTKAWITVLTCAEDQEKQLCWIAVRVGNRFSIPLILPEESTRIYCYDEKTNMLSWVFTSFQRISTIAPFNTGFIFLRDHYAFLDYFLDEEICFYDTVSKRLTVFTKPRTVGKLLAVHDDIVYYQGALAYNDTDVYAYNINTQEIRTICKDVNTAYADRQHLYIISNTHPVRLDIYDIDTEDLTDSVTLKTNDDIIEAGDGKALAADGTVYFLDHSDTQISDDSLGSKKIETGWIDEDHLVIVSDNVLESYTIGTERIEQVFSYILDDDILNVNMLHNRIILLHKGEVMLIIMDVDGKNELSVHFPSAN